MLKEKYEIAKKFVKEHKKEILIGAGIIAGSLVALYMGKKLIDVKPITNHNEDAFSKAYNKAAEIANETLIPEINAKYEKYDFSNIENNPAMKIIYDQYMEEYESKFNALVKSLM